MASKMQLGSTPKHVATHQAADCQQLINLIHAIGIAGLRIKRAGPEQAGAIQQQATLTSCSHPAPGQLHEPLNLF